MDRIESAFTDKPIFMPYFPLGYPDLETSIAVIEALAQNGADLVELGLSFSDPLADGPVIQQAAQLALEKGITVGRSLQAVAELRRRGVTIPLVLMGYYNPMLAYGLEKFIRHSREAGADGFIVPDLPLEEAGEFQSMLDAGRVHGEALSPSYRDLPLIRMLAPTTPDERMESIARDAKGFIYLVSVTGVTGARSSISEGLGDLINRVREHTSAPVCVGFGIGTPEQARQVGALADGVIVGSACVKSIGGSGRPVEAARKFAAEFSRRTTGKPMPGNPPTLK
jgi:tryptophan synthase alpha chain